MEPYIESLISKKAEVVEARCKDRVNIIISDGVPLYFRHRDDAFFPLLKLLQQYPIMMPRIQVDKGAIRFVLSGANIMCRGITSPGGRCDVDLPEGAPVAIFAEGKVHPLAVGVLKMSTADIKSKNTGIAIEVLHYLDDNLWRAHDDLVR